MASSDLSISEFEIGCASEKRAQPGLICVDWATSLTVYNIDHKPGVRHWMQAAKFLVLCILIWRPGCLPIFLQNSRAPTRRRHPRSSILLFRLLEIILGTVNALGTVKCWADCQRQLLHHQKGDQQNVGGLGSQSSLPHIKPTKHYFHAKQEIPTTRTAMAVNFFWWYTIRKTTCYCFFFSKAGKKMKEISSIGRRIWNRLKSRWSLEGLVRARPKNPQFGSKDYFRRHWVKTEWVPFWG